MAIKVHEITEDDLKEELLVVLRRAVTTEDDDGKLMLFQIMGAAGEAMALLIEEET